MKAVWNLLIVLALVAAAGMVGFYIGHRAAGNADQADSDSDADDIKPAPLVQTAQIKKGHIDRNIIAFGIVADQTGGASVLSVPFESQVKKILVIPGQRLDPNQPVMDLVPSPEALLELDQAKSALDAANTDLEQTRRRFNDHLATNQDLLQSQQNLDSARMKLRYLANSGASGPVQLKSSGLVDKIDVQEGQIVPAGTTLLEINGAKSSQVRLGVDPSDIANIHVGDPVSLQLIHSDAPAVQGKVAMVGQRIDPDSHMPIVLVSIPRDANLPLDSYVRAQFTVPGQHGLVVPRSAVLPGDDGYTLFTIDGAKAAEHKVSITAEDDQSIEITGEGLSAGQPVVTVGNFELEDGMSVTTAGPSTQTAASQPAPQEAAP